MNCSQIPNSKLLKKDSQNNSLSVNNESPFGKDLIGCPKTVFSDEYLKKYPYGKNLDGSPAQPFSDEYYKKFPYGKDLTNPIR